MSSGKPIPKIAVEVEITRLDGSRIRGDVFIAANERVLDMLNGSNPFFPFRHADNRRVLLLGKASIVSIEPLDQKG
jgi:hypothetical protein